jgi:hypothetical protein
VFWGKFTAIPAWAHFGITLTNFAVEIWSWSHPGLAAGDYPDAAKPLLGLGQA